MPLAALAGLLLAQLQPTPPGAQAEYDDKYLDFADLTEANQFGAMREWTLPRQGKSRRPVEGEEFYRLVGRDDLLARYRENETKRTTVRVVGIAIALGVPLIAFATASRKDCGAEPATYDPNFASLSQQYSACTSHNDQAQMTSLVIGGLGVAVGLGIAVFGGNSIEVHPIGAGEAQRLGDEYNKRLKEGLGLPDRGPRVRTSPAPVVAVSLLPVRGGGTVGLSLRF
jgi:hypothetical protein